MAKVLVELDIHVGLSESLEIDYWGHILVWRLDYQCIPFRCTLYRRTRYLRKDCQKVLGVSYSEESMEEMSKDLYTTGVDT